jgi:hypothetical protein
MLSTFRQRTLALLKEDQNSRDSRSQAREFLDGLPRFWWQRREDDSDQNDSYQYPLIRVQPGQSATRSLRAQLVDVDLADYFEVFGRSTRVRIGHEHRSSGASCCDACCRSADGQSSIAGEGCGRVPWSELLDGGQDFIEPDVQQASRLLCLRLR